ncbi:MAG: LysR family transcriptional regulator [Alphaproteobacteria bacterium]|jgi:DNA-binding transcriptional LysR family regulator|nr:LysR family transcriptional regulator [Alphaproteobacteria bacterium]
MNTSNSPDWSHIEAFVTVAEAGSLSAAARGSAMSQPTLSRHIAALEEGLGQRLMHRGREGIRLTPAGLKLLAEAQNMADAAARISMLAEGRSQALTGTVRLTASCVVAAYLLPGILAELRREEPGIAVEVVASDETENLLRREADIAVRMYRPTQPDVITRKVADFPIGVFAAPDYLARRGTPAAPEDLMAHDVIGYDRSTLVIDGLAAAGLKVDRDFFAFRSDDQVVCWQMVVAGFGIGFMNRNIGRAEPRVTEIHTGAPLPSVPAWLTAHSELRTQPRVRRVFDWLSDKLAGLSGGHPAR